MFVGREETLNGQVHVPNLIKQEKFEASINLPTERKFFCLCNCQVKGDVTSPNDFRLSSWIEIQPPRKKEMTD